MKASKKLISASCALVAALAISVGSTYAWFTTQSTAEVTGIKATVTTGDSSLEMKLVQADGSDITGQNWRYNLDLSSANLFDGVKLDALTYLDGKSDGDVSTAGLYKSDKKTAATAVTIGTDGKISNAAAVSHIEFYLAFRSKEQKEIYLLSSSTVRGTGKSFKAWTKLTGTEYGHDGDIESGNTFYVYAKNAIRVGFNSAKHAAGSDTGLDTFGDMKIWDPNATTSEFKDGSSVLAEEYAKYLGISDGPSYEADYTANVTTVANATAGSTEAIAQMDSQAVSQGTDSGYYYTCVKITIWLEGTDPECMDGIFADDVTIGLHFDSKKVAGE